MRFGMGYGAWTGGPFGKSGHHPSDHERHGDGRRGGRRRVFDGGELKLVLLKLIADAPRHGYDLIREIEGLSGGGYAPSPGVIYPTLTMLDEMGLIEEHRSEGTKKRFAVTEAGRTELAEQAEQVEALLARLAVLADHRERTDGAPIRRAMGNLRQVLQHRLMRDDVTADTLHDVAELIDEAARKIERMA